MGKYISFAPILEGTAGEGAHPICVIKKLKERGILVEAARNPSAYREQIIDAAVECKREGKLHGIYKLVREVAARR